MKNKRGITLVELLAAMVVSALVITLASRFFLTHHREFLQGVFQSERLVLLNRVNAFMKDKCQEKIQRCTHGQLILDADSGALELNQWVKQKFPEADSIHFECFEVEPGTMQLQAWQGRFQPELVEYRLLLKTRGTSDWLEGSVLR